MVTTLALPAPVEAPPATLPHVGLLASCDALGRTERNTTHQRWEIGGASYRPIAAGAGGIARSADGTVEGTDVYDDTNTDTKAGDPDMGLPAGLVTGYPFMVETSETESTFGWTAENYENRVTQRLDALTSKILEREFWTGEVAQALDLDPDVYQWLAQTSAVDLTPGSGAVIPRIALSLIEDALGDASNGVTFIHMARQAAMMTPDRWSEGPIIVWPDSTVVVGAGYPATGPDGTDPDAGEQWVYGTNPCNIRLGPVEIWPPDFAEAIDKHHNTIDYRAQRMALVTWDGNVHVAVRTTTTAPS